jgi:thermospermine synthase
VFVSFEDVMAYTTHVPSFADTWGWVMVIKIRRKIACVINLFLLFIYTMLEIQASDQPLFIGSEEMDKRMEERINGELLYLTGDWFDSSTTMNKTLSKS